MLHSDSQRRNISLHKSDLLKCVPPPPGWCPTLRSWKCRGRKASCPGLWRAPQRLRLWQRCTAGRRSARVPGPPPCGHRGRDAGSRQKPATRPGVQRGYCRWTPLGHFLKTETQNKSDPPDSEPIKRSVGTESSPMVAASLSCSLPSPASLLLTEPHSSS